MIVKINVSFYKHVSIGHLLNLTVVDSIKGRVVIKRISENFSKKSDSLFLYGAFLNFLVEKAMTIKQTKGPLMQ